MYFFVLVSTIQECNFQLDTDRLIDNALSFFKLVNSLMLSLTILFVSKLVQHFSANVMEHGNLTEILTFLRFTVALMRWVSFYSFDIWLDIYDVKCQ